MNILRTKWFKISALVLALGLVSAGFWFWFNTGGPISDYTDPRDTKEILNIFKRDRYWLLASEDYSPEFMLKHHAPNQELKYMGRLNIKVMHKRKICRLYCLLHENTSIWVSPVFGCESRV